MESMDDIAGVMPIISLPEADELRALFKYDPITGSLTWKERPPTTRANKTHNSRDAGHQVGAIDTWGHRQVRVNGRLTAVHRVIWKMMTGEDPVDQIDHINGEPDDNRWENMRQADSQQNSWNKGLNGNSTSGYNCIYPMHTKRASSKKFRVLMHIDGRKRLIGDFYTIEEAKAAYDTAFATYRDQRFKR